MFWRNLKLLCRIDSLQNKSLKYVKAETRSQFSVNHYTGQVTYDVRDMPEKNKDFLPPELINTFRLSENPIVRTMFMNKLDKFGNLNVQVENEKATGDGSSMVRINFQIGEWEVITLPFLGRPVLANQKDANISKSLQNLLPGSSQGVIHRRRHWRNTLREMPQNWLERNT